MLKAHLSVKISSKSVSLIIIVQGSHFRITEVNFKVDKDPV